MTAQMAFLFSGRTKDSVMYVVTHQAWKYRDGFPLWLSTNWPIWERFAAEADRVYEAGRRHWSSRTIVEYLRHETALRERGREFKIDNDAAPDLARLYLTLYPERQIFSLRKSPERQLA